jgi:hypothetical protein
LKVADIETQTPAGRSEIGGGNRLNLVGGEFEGLDAKADVLRLGGAVVLYEPNGAFD